MSYLHPDNDTERWGLAYMAALLLHGAILAVFVWFPDIFHTTLPQETVFDIQIIDIPQARKASPIPPKENDNLPPDKTKNISPSQVISKPAEDKTSKKIVKNKRQEPVADKTTSIKKKDVEKKPRQTTKQAKTVKAEKKPVKKLEATQDQKTLKENREEMLEQRLASIQHKVKAEKKAEELLGNRLAALASRVAKKQRGSQHGNSINPGGLDTASAYGRVLKNRIRNRWSYPASLFATKGLKVTVAITINNDGSINAIRFEKKSGNALFDSSVMRAIKAAAPFPPLPEDLKPGPWEAGFNFDIENLDPYS
jgi:colicin import membrane protein